MFDVFLIDFSVSVSVSVRVRFLPEKLITTNSSLIESPS